MPHAPINGIDIYRANLFPRGSGSGFKLFINYISFVIFGVFKLFFIKRKFDKIFVYAPSPITVGYLGVFASFIFRAKPFLWVHDLWPESVKDAGGINNKFILGLIDLMTRSIYYFYESILVQSPDFKKYLMAQGVNEKKLTYVSDGARSLVHQSNIQDFLICNRRYNLQLSYGGIWNLEIHN